MLTPALRAFSVIVRYAGIQTLLAMKSDVRASVAPDGNNALACAVALHAPPALVDALLDDPSSVRVMGAVVGKPSAFSFSSGTFLSQC